MSIHEDEGRPSSIDVKQQMKILAQLFKMIPTFRHIDELFQWLASTIAQQCNTQSIQFWANQTNIRGQHTMQLRAMTCQNISIPRPLIANNDIALLAQKITYEQRIYNSQTIDSLFPRYRASVLGRYGLNFFAACFICVNLLLPPMNDEVPADIPTPLAMAIILFLSQPPHVDLMPSIMTIINQAITIAGTHGLLLPTVTTSEEASEQELPPLEKLIPHRKQNSDLMLSNNPLSRSTAITDRSARRLYAAIDGQRDMATLCRQVDIPMSEAYAALQILLTQQRIEVRKASGMLIDTKFLV